MAESLDVEIVAMKLDGKRKRDGHGGGFTLVELIVVLVILGILAAIMVPALLGWIDKARNQDAILECRNVVMAAQGTFAEEYARGIENGAMMDNRLNDLAGEIVKLADADGTIGVGSIVTTDSIVSKLTYNKNNGVTVLYDREHSPVYWIEEGGYTGKTGKDHTTSLTDRLTHDNILQDGKLNKDKLDEWLERTNNKNNSNNNDSRAVQEYFLKMTGGEEFPEISKAEKNMIINMLQNYNPPITVANDFLDNLTWKPTVTSNNEVILVAGSKGGKGDNLGAFIYYNGNYYGKLNNNGTSITTVYIKEGQFNTDTLNDNYVKDSWVNIGN